jgi:hypothetical protein
MDVKPVIILGMHRSGTSCLAGSLEQGGLYLGQVNKKAPHNAKGNRENRDIMDLNDTVLTAAGGSWDNPPRSTTPWSADQVAIRSALIATYPGDRIWGFKEPRTMFTLEGWLDALPGVRLVGTFRHPTAVAQSLKTRNKFSMEQGMELWLAYNQRLLEISRKRKILFINFDWPPKRYEIALAGMLVELGLAVPTRGFDFFESGLRRNSACLQTELPTEVSKVYDALLDNVSHDETI